MLARLRRVLMAASMWGGGGVILPSLRKTMRTWAWAYAQGEGEGEGEGESEGKVRARDGGKWHGPAGEG